MDPRCDIVLSPSDQCLAMIDNDEQQFQQENAFIQDDAMDFSQSSHGLLDSWSLPSQTVTMSPPSWFTSEEQASAAYMRISIGTLIGAKTEVLGTLEGNDGGQRVSWQIMYSLSFSLCQAMYFLSFNVDWVIFLKHTHRCLGVYQ